MRNLNLLFNKEYYQQLGTPDFKKDVIECNKVLIGEEFDEKTDYAEPKFSDCQRFRLSTVYPGLLIGTGNPHGAGDIGGSDEDVNLGFSFDYVTGQPYIPGSSVKGVLRSHFKDHPDAVVEIFNENGVAGITEDNIEELEKQIFEKDNVFFDAVICKGDADGKMLGFDYITPHGSATQSPVPIRIIKVLPNVQFEFRFKLTGIDDIKLSAGKLKHIFKELILLFGAGAKTNVGYGVFTDEGVEQPKAPKSSKKGKKKKKENVV